MNFSLSEEQQNFIDYALSGCNILVDACIGSGKTTAIQHLCELISEDKKILYLTYNKLLKIDAKNKIRCKNVTVNNYHGLAWMLIKRNGLTSSVSDSIQTVVNNDIIIPQYDVLIIDEYQDIEQELADFLLKIKRVNPNMQIIAVGDMEQKIYDKTTLDVSSFIQEFLGEYRRLTFTKCFRLSKDLAAMLGRIWNKPIVGVNDSCSVDEIDIQEVADFLRQQEPADILCLGSRNGSMSDVLNELEEVCPEKFNKGTVYATISDSEKGTVAPKSSSAIFTTYDGSKGLERKICVIFDFTEKYWNLRIQKPQTAFEILRNIFCVAASRGKDKIVFVRNGTMLSEKTLSKTVESNTDFKKFDISSMFDFKYREDIEKCFNCLETAQIPQDDKTIIFINNKDGLIDLAPCIGTYQQAAYFNQYNIDLAIEFASHFSKSYFYQNDVSKLSLDEKILILTAIETNQERYVKQVNIPFVSSDQRLQIEKRLSSVFEKNDNTQTECKIKFSYSKDGNVKFTAEGLTDAVKDDIVYELKFVSEVTHEHFLQCACYMYALNLKKGILWNTRDNSMYSVVIKNKKQFIDNVTNAITKGFIKKYYKPSEI